MPKPLISVVVPYYRNYIGLCEVVEALEKLDLSFELIVVDDSNDLNSWRALGGLKSSLTIKKIRLSKNFGQHPALLAGFEHVKGDVVMTLDDDHALLVPYLPQFIDAFLEDDQDIYYAQFSEKRPILRTVATKMYRIFSSFAGKNHGKGSSVRLMKSSLVHKITIEKRNVYFIDELVLWFTNGIYFYDLKVSLPLSTSRYTLRQLLGLSLSKSYYASDRPLKFVAFLGALISLISFIFGLVVLYKKYVNKIEVEGYTSLIVSILFSTGLLMFSVGVLAMYVRQILLRLNHAPLFSVQEIIE